MQPSMGSNRSGETEGQSEDEIDPCLPVRRQVMAADVLVGMHGAALSNGHFMRPMPPAAALVPALMGRAHDAGARPLQVLGSAVVEIRQCQFDTALARKVFQVRLPLVQ